MSTALAEFVAKKTLHPNCWTCRLPEVADLNAGFLKGVGVAMLCAYLSEEKNLGDVNMLEGKVRGHFRRGHHLDGTESS